MTSLVTRALLHAGSIKNLEKRAQLAQRGRHRR
jgi:hypothetical protein